MNELRFVVTAALMLCGAFMIVSSILGVFRFRFALNRIHSAAMTDTLGFGLIIIGLMVSADSLFTALKLLALFIFMWLTNPVASHMLTKLEITTDREIKEHCKVSDADLESIKNDGEEDEE